MSSSGQGGDQGQSVASPERPPVGGVSDGRERLAEAPSDEVDRSRSRFAAAAVRKLRASVLAYSTVYAGILALIAWSLLSMRIAPRILPSPLDVGESFLYQIQIGTLPVYTWSSLTVLITAALVGVVFGVPLGFLIGSTRTFSKMLTPMVGFLYAISGIAWIPMFIIWFGFTRTTVMAVVNYSLIFPVIYNTALGVRSVRPVYRHAALTLGAGRLRVVRDVLLPGALPNIAAGIRIGVAYGWRGLIAGELLIASPGLGYLLFDARAAQDTATIIAGMIAIGVSWLVMDHVFLRPAEQHTVERWGLVEKAS